MFAIWPLCQAKARDSSQRRGALPGFYDQDPHSNSSFEVAHKGEPGSGWSHRLHLVTAYPPEVELSTIQEEKPGLKGQKEERWCSDWGTGQFGRNKSGHPHIRRRDKHTRGRINKAIFRAVAGFVFAMAEWDLTSRMGPYLDRHLVFPLLEFLTVKGIYEEIDLDRGKLDLLSDTNMVDFVMDVHKRLYPGEEEQHISMSWKLLPMLRSTMHFIDIQSHSRTVKLS